MDRVLLNDRYELRERLGSGGMARVHRAHDHVLGRLVAIKSLHDDLGDDQEITARFLREARIFARLRHPHIVEIHDVLTLDRGAAMVMELVEGTDLSRVLKAGAPMVPELAVLLLRPVADALAYAHGEGIVHRDIKPANILIGRDGRVKLSDFGIAKLAEETHLTRTGDFLGTPAYIAPEQARGELVGPAADQYALGAVLYEAVTGRPPYVGPTAMAVLTQILTGSFPDPRELSPAVDESLATIINRMLAPDPANRFPDVRAVLTVLDAYTHAVGVDRERRLLAELVDDPRTTVTRMATEVARAKITAARRALEAGDRDGARALALAALARDPDDAEIRTFLDHLDASPPHHTVLPAPADFRPAAPDAPTTPRPTPLPTFGRRRQRLVLGLVTGAVTAAVVLAAWFGLRDTPRRPSIAAPAPDAGPLASARAPVPAPPVADAGSDAAPTALADAGSDAAPVTDVAPPSARKPDRDPARKSGSRRPTTGARAARDPQPPPRPPTAPPSDAAPVAKAPAADDRPPPSADAAPKPAAPARLRIHTAPWADVYVDGKLRGRTPYLNELTLPPGKHRLRLLNPGFPPHEEILDLTAGQVVHRRIRLGPRR